MLGRLLSDAQRLSPDTRRLRAILQALFVTFLWATSWVLIKVGLKDIPALTFAGLRYSLAFIVLLPFALRPVYLGNLRRLSRRDWAVLAALGVLFYAITQGAQFVGLVYLPAVTVSLLLNFTTVAVTLLGIALLSEHPTGSQWLGVLIALAGALVYFFPVLVPANQAFGLVVMGIGVLANALSAVLGRAINRRSHIHPLLVTTVSMGTGAGLLLVAGVAVQGFPAISPAGWLLIAWLAVVNTAFAFTLWNHTLRTLTAMESSIINNTMLVQIALLAWVFLGEGITLQEAFGILLVAGGTLLAQLRTR